MPDLAASALNVLAAWSCGASAIGTDEQPARADTTASDRNNFFNMGGLSDEGEAAEGGPCPHDGPFRFVKRFSVAIQPDLSKGDRPGRGRPPDSRVAPRRQTLRLAFSVTSALDVTAGCRRRETWRPHHAAVHTSRPTISARVPFSVPGERRYDTGATAPRASSWRPPTEPLSCSTPSPSAPA